MKRSASCFFPLIALILAPTLEVFSAESDKNEAAEHVIASAAYLGALPHFSVDIELNFSLTQENGNNEDISLQSKLDFSGTDHARFQVIAPEDTLELYTKKDATFVFLKKSNKYIDRSDVGSRAEALIMMPSGPFRGSQMLMSDVLQGAPAFQKTVGESQVTQAETSSVEGSSEYAVTNDDLATEFWIQNGDTPLLQKFTLDLTRLAAQRGDGVKSAIVTYTFSNWNLNPEFSEDHFTFSIPEGATEFSPAQNEPEVSPMEGLPAPNITAPLLAGGDLDLSTLKGKKIVVLDFWASWCGPCRIGLPIVTRVVEKYKDKDVVLYAVNIGEDRATVQAFVEQMGLDAPVALDEKRVAQADYQANSIPKTVIVDQEGIVRKVHDGLSPTFEKEMDALLAELTK